MSLSPREKTNFYTCFAFFFFLVPQSLKHFGGIFCVGDVKNMTIQSFLASEKMVPHKVDIDANIMVFF